MMKADRNGFFFVANRETGKMISAEKYVRELGEEVRYQHHARRGGSRQASAARPSCQGHLPEPDRRQELAADVVQSADRPRLHSDQQYLHGLVGRVMSTTSGACSISALNSRPRKGHGGYLGELVAWDPVEQQEGLGHEVRSAIQWRHAGDRRRSGVLGRSARRFPRASTPRPARCCGEEPRKRHRCGPDDLLGRMASNTSPSSSDAQRRFLPSLARSARRCCGYARRRRAVRVHARLKPEKGGGDEFQYTSQALAASTLALAAGVGIPPGFAQDAPVSVRTN